MTNKFCKFFLSIVFFGMAASLTARDIRVGPDERLKTLAEALALAEPGDRLLVQAGTYAESPVLVNKSVQIIGQGFPVLDGEGRHQIMTVTADSVTVEGLVFANAGVSFVEDKAAIKLEKTQGCVIANNRFINNFFGIYLAESAGTIIRGNEIHASSQREAVSGNGIHAWYCKDLRIEDNRISGHRDGIYFEFVEDGMIRRNLSEKNLRYGLHFMFSHHCRYVENVFRHNGAGVAVMYTKYIEMEGNRFEQNRGSASFGILLKEIMDSRIRHNYFTENTVALFTEGSNRLLVEENTFSRNGWAVKIMANSMENEFRRNNFLENTFDVATNSRQNFNTFAGNYWSRYRGYDLNRDGVGDVPFRPVRLFSFMIEKQASALVLLRSVVVDLLDLAESLIPLLTPETLVDAEPQMAALEF